MNKLAALGLLESGAAHKLVSSIRRRYWLAPMLLIMLFQISLLRAGETEDNHRLLPSVDRESLRGLFEKVFNDSFRFVSDRVVEKEKSIFWLVTVQPLRNGKFIIRYDYDLKGTGYDHGIHEFHVRVGANGTKRYIFADGQVSPDLCVGDFLILPIEISPWMEGHAFKNMSGYGKGTHYSCEIPEQTYQLPSNITKTSRSSGLHLCGTSIHSILCAGLNYRHYHQAEFIALKANRTNLLLTCSLSQTPKRIVPVLIVPKNEPIRVLASPVRGNEWKEKGGSSSVNISYICNRQTLRVGDRIALVYLMTESKEPKPTVKPELKISYEAFLPDNKWHDNWISDE